MYYESSDFLETADSDTLKQIARTRELTRKYYFSDYRDTEKRTSILRELLGGMGENVAIDTPFHCDYGKNIFLGNDVIINMNCTFVDNKNYPNWRQGIDCVKCAECIHLRTLYCHRKGLCRMRRNARQSFSEPMHVR